MVAAAAGRVGSGGSRPAVARDRGGGKDSLPSFSSDFLYSPSGLFFFLCFILSGNTKETQRVLPLLRARKGWGCG
ncbi:uncharacterized protein DS421_17g589800 [Arachis hypogaea]|nr:uncharacterized protein DS421_17g589800 [Arachis hypogaea]